MTKFQDWFTEKEQVLNNKVPNLKEVKIYLEEALDLIFPGFTRKQFADIDTFNLALNKHHEHLMAFLKCFNVAESKRSAIAKTYLDDLREIAAKLKLDCEAIYAGDPAAKNLAEVVLSYPGPYAIATYRLAHYFYINEVEILPRMLTEISHTKTGIDIHPGATIGEAFFIDHGTGIVIGETANIGNRVKVYQGVTLGALSVEKNLQNKKRHPTIEDGVVIYAHATILGGETIIGRESIIGGNVWITKSIAPHSVVYHRSEIKLDKKISECDELIYEI